MSNQSYLVINKSWKHLIISWDTKGNKDLQSLKEKLMQNEFSEHSLNLKSLTKIEFPEIFEHLPIKQVQGIIKFWGETNAI